MTSEPWFHPEAIEGVFNPKPTPSGTLTKARILAAQEQIRRHRPQPTKILTSMRTIESGWWGARYRELAAECAMDELAETPRWRWLRRRAINRQIDSHLHNAEALRGAFGWPS